MLLFAESFQTTVSVFGNLDIVINNAGIMNDRFWELEVDINLVSTKIIYVNKTMLFRGLLCMLLCCVHLCE